MHQSNLILKVGNYKIEKTNNLIQVTISDIISSSLVKGYGADWESALQNAIYKFIQQNGPPKDFMLN